MKQEWPDIESNIYSTEDIHSLAAEIDQLAEEMGFSTLHRIQIDCAFKEIASNAIAYAAGGHVAIRSVNNGKVLIMEIGDNGPGIANLVEEAWNGLSQQMSLGLGISRARSLVDRLLIRSQPNEGTRVTMEKFLPFSSNAIGYGVLTLPHFEGDYNGDHYLIKEYEGDKLLMAIIDAGEESYLSHLIAGAIQKLLSQNFDRGLEQLWHLCKKHVDLIKNQTPWSIGLVRLDNEQVSYLLMGDVHGYIYRSNTLIQLEVNSSSSTIIHRLPRSYLAKKIILCTKGIQSKIDELVFADGLDAQQMANLVMNNCRNPNFDATVLVSQINAVNLRAPSPNAGPHGNATPLY